MQRLTVTAEIQQDAHGLETTQWLETTRWLAEVPELPGCRAYGDTPEEAKRGAVSLALHVLGDLVAHGSLAPADLEVRFPESAAT